MENKLFTREEIEYLKHLMQKDCDEISRLEGAIRDDGWIYEIYNLCDSIIDKLDKIELVVSTDKRKEVINSLWK